MGVSSWMPLTKLGYIEGKRKLVRKRDRFNFYYVKECGNCHSTTIEYYAASIMVGAEDIAVTQIRSLYPWN